MQNLKNFLFRQIQSLQFIRLSSSSQPAEFISSNLHNGVGRYVCQLQRVTFKFCKEHPNSRGMRHLNFLLIYMKEIVSFSKTKLI